MKDQTHNHQISSADLFPYRWRDIFAKKFFMFHVVLVIAVALSACAPQTAPTPEVTSTQAGRPTASPAPRATLAASATPTEVLSPAVTSLDGVRKATVQILTRGKFMDPEIGTQQVFAGKGSGFIIDESGLAVTNNHVVTGAAVVEVKMNGEIEPRNARILGASECSDLAVIDIEGEGFPYLEWYDQPISVGTDVYAAGFPLGDPEYTLTRGIVSKEHANGEVSWASVEYVIEHDANINPGNSGGPLVAADGKVVGVNYASYEAADQSFAISRDEAIEILDELQAGQNLYSIGVNGLAVSDGEDLSGIWVSSIKSGSPADDVGLEPGDIITEMEGMGLATDGTMATYCDILRTHRADDTLSIEVLRLETKEVFKGQINGRRLEMVSSLAEKDSEVSADGSHEGSYAEYVTATDDLNMIEIEIPAAWGEVDGSPWVSGGEMFGVSISAAADLESFYNSWSESGVFFGASHKLARLAGYVQVLDSEREYFSQDCQLEGRYDYNDAMYRGKYDVWNNCGGTETTVIVISAVLKENPTEYLILVEIVVTQEADLEALEHIVDSFMVIGDLKSLEALAHK